VERCHLVLEVILSFRRQIAIVSIVRDQGKKGVGRSPPRRAIQLLFATGKSFTVDGLREKLPDFFGSSASKRPTRLPIRQVLKELVAIPAFTKVFCLPTWDVYVTLKE
jgi:hypothetical protein